MLGNFFFFFGLCYFSYLFIHFMTCKYIYVPVQRTLIGLCSISCSPYADIYSTSLYEDNTNYYPCCIVGFDFLSTGGLQIVACKVLLSRLENTKGLDGMWVFKSLLILVFEGGYFFGETFRTPLQVQFSSSGFILHWFLLYTFFFLMCALCENRSIINIVFVFLFNSK